MRRASRAIIIKDDKLLVTKRNKFGKKYYILIGGGVDQGETELQALYRELQEESGVQVANPRLVFTEYAGIMYGLQQVFLCDYVSGEPALDPNSTEAKISAMGKNLYVPMWLPLSDLPNVEFRSPALQTAILEGLQNGFPTEPKDITAHQNIFFRKP
jgi:8-oxo-dGTP pyrophosphatase MutT (NUDIX family)